MAQLTFPAVRAYYDGKPQEATSGKVFHTIDPATARPLAVVQESSHKDIDLAISSATRAFPSWAATPPMERSRVLLKAVQLLRGLNDELAEVETRDTGKPFSETQAVDVVTGADVLEYFANLVGGGGLNGETAQLREDAWVYTKKEPLGVCVGIGAWNYPIQIALWKSAPCLAAGNTMVYKPSEFTPLHASYLAATYTAAGLPPGVFNVVHGDGVAAGQYLVSHPSIAKVSFTGQVSTGQKVAGAAAGGMKYVTMELGGKSPLIVLPGADIEQAVDGAMMANFFSSGQVCTNGTRVFVHEDAKPAFEARLLQKMNFIRMGDLMDPKTNFGPLVSEPHFKKVTAAFDHGVNVDRAKVLYSAQDQPRRSLPPGTENGYWFPPVVFTNCTDDMHIVREEIFGPIMSILSYKTIDEVVSRANKTEMGLAAGVFGTDLNLAHKIAAKLQAGILWINSWGESPAEMSVGGWKKSGVGVENGRRGIEAWVRNKSTLVDMGGQVATAFTPLKRQENL